MNELSKIQKALNYRDAGQSKKAMAIYLKILAKKPKSFDARQLLALGYHESGDLDAAIMQFKKAIKINPNHASVRVNLANSFLEVGKLKNAQLQLNKACALDNRLAALHNSFGKLYSLQHRHNESLEAYQKAVEFEPQNAFYRDNTGVAFYKLGRFKEALDSLTIAHNMDMRAESVVVHLFDLLMMMQQYPEAVGMGLKTIDQNSLTNANKAAIQIGVAKICWLENELSLLDKLLADSAIILSEQQSTKNTRNFKAFHHHLSLLSKFQKNHHRLYEATTDKTIFMISESHGFGPARTSVRFSNEAFSIRSFLITGCKLFHLASNKANMFQASLQILLSKLPKQSKIIIGFGEIDCRIDEGIFPHYVKNNLPFETNLSIMAANYVSNICALAREYSHTILLYGIPAPNPAVLKDLTQKTTDQYLELFSNLNESLAAESNRAGCIFLDTYAYTRDKNGAGKIERYMDNVHLYPDTLANLFNNLPQHAD